MANYSFDVTTGADLQEVDNAVNQTIKEVNQRYDFKGTKCSVDFDRTKAEIKLEADDDFRMKQLFEVLHGKLVRRKVPVKNLEVGEDQEVSGGRFRREITLTQSISSDTAREIVKAVKAQKLKKVQVAIQGDQLRVTSPSKDELQNVMGFLKGEDWGIELQFGNYR